MHLCCFLYNNLSCVNWAEMGFNVHRMRILKSLQCRFIKVIKYLEIIIDREPLVSLVSSKYQDQSAVNQMCHDKKILKKYQCFSICLRGHFQHFLINGNLDGSVYFSKCGLMWNKALKVDLLRTRKTARDAEFLISNQIEPKRDLNDMGPNCRQYSNISSNYHESSEPFSVH